MDGGLFEMKFLREVPKTQRALLDYYRKLERKNEVRIVQVAERFVVRIYIPNKK